ncbi:MAG: phosphoribosylamine--glycine ligase, partial [Verrucomicrobiota bacterium]
MSDNQSAANGMKILVVGKGGREHALVRALDESASSRTLFSFPGSDAIFEIAKPAPGVSDVPSLVAFMVEEGVDLCVAGEESYLLKGLADQCQKAGLPCWGPVEAAARLEGSKEFAKEFMFRHEIPTGGYMAASTANEARAAIKSYPCVLKFDGLAAGKGVAVCQTEAEAEAFLKQVFDDRQFGEGRLLVEEFLEGPEVSVFCGVVDDVYEIFTPARDYKRLADNDEGLNTGGMGAVASRGLIDEELLAEIDRSIIRKTVDGLRKDGLPSRGFLYFGIMLTAAGPKILEYNCRFGDPECQAVMPLVKGDLAAFVRAGAEGRLEPEHIRYDNGWSICLVKASAGYPVTSRSGDEISGLDSLGEGRVYHAG